MRSHLVIPDTQVRPGVPVQHLEWVGRYIAERKPDVVIHLGDHYDMPSLNEYDRIKKAKAFHSASYADDLEAGDRGFDLLVKPLSRSKTYTPMKVFMRGNHCDRVTRLFGTNPNMEGALRVPWDYPRSLGWKVPGYLEPLDIDGVWYAHYFYNPLTGRPWGGDARYKLKQLHRSFTMGHVQGLDQCLLSLATGQRIRGLVAGSCYLHDESYRGPQARNEWRGVLVKHQVSKGDYDLMEVSLDFLERKFG